MRRATGSVATLVLLAAVLVRGGGADAAGEQRKYDWPRFSFDSAKSADNQFGRTIAPSGEAGLELLSDVPLSKTFGGGGGITGSSPAVAPKRLFDYSGANDWGDGKTWRRSWTAFPADGGARPGAADSSH